MLREFFINTTILISFIFLGGQLFRHNPISLSSKWERKVLFGILAGLVGILLMEFGITLDSSTLIDLRHLAVMLAAFYGGVVSAVVSSVFVALGRIYLYGLSDSSLIAFITTLIVGFVCGYISFLSVSGLIRWTSMTIFSLVSASAALYIALKDENVLHILFPYYWSTSLFGAIIVYQLTTHITHSNALYRQFRESSTKDFLTGLHNVRYFQEAIQRDWHEAHHKEQSLSLILLDIDFFKSVNDTYGHIAGDKVLQTLGMILSNLSTSTKQTVSRNGGEEFTILMPQYTHSQALEFAERIRGTIQRYPFTLPDGTNLKMTISIGVATYPNHANDPTDLLHQADVALYKAKREGRNQVCSSEAC